MAPQQAEQDLQRLLHRLPDRPDDGPGLRAVALGYTLVYGILQLINFAHGDVFALTGLFASTMILEVFNLQESSDTITIILGLAATLLVVVAFGATVNSVIERVAYRRLFRAPRWRF